MKNSLYKHMPDRENRPDILREVQLNKPSQCDLNKKLQYSQQYSVTERPQEKDRAGNTEKCT